MKLLVTVIILFGSFNAHAGLFGPSNYNECVIDGLKDITNDKAIALLKQTCADEFPTKEQKENKSKYKQVTKQLKSCGVKGYAFEYFLPIGHPASKDFLNKVVKGKTQYDPNKHPEVYLSNVTKYALSGLKLGWAEKGKDCGKENVFRVKCTALPVGTPLYPGNTGNFFCDSVNYSVVDTNKNYKYCLISAKIGKISNEGSHEEQLLDFLQNEGFCKK